MFRHWVIPKPCAGQCGSSSARELSARASSSGTGISTHRCCACADLTRLGRSTADLADIVTVLDQRGRGFRSLTESLLDTTSAHGKLIFDMFASLAEYERSRLSERTKAGLAAAKASGRLGNLPRSMTPGKLETARQLRSEGNTLKKTAERLSVSVSSLTRALRPDG
ncbi:recombinase family protein [Arthrobacter sp. ISL-28]|nr:recombinase family protein [Arthrobacter sp. ISL-28]